MSYVDFAETARKRGMHEVMIHARRRECRPVKSVFMLDNETVSDAISRTRSLPQGYPATPMLFILILDTLAEGSCHAQLL